MKSRKREWDGLEIVECKKSKRWQKSSFSGAVKAAWLSRGLTAEQVETKWQEYVNLPKNRSLKAKLEQNERARRMMGNGAH